MLARPMHIVIQSKKSILLYQYYANLKNAQDDAAFSLERQLDVLLVRSERLLSELKCDYM
jgi:hypothetical protein